MEASKGNHFFILSPSKQLTHIRITCSASPTPDSLYLRPSLHWVTNHLSFPGSEGFPGRWHCHISERASPGLTKMNGSPCFPWSTGLHLS